MVREMTRGKPLPIIISFCIPLLLGNIFQQIYNMADSIIVGRFIGVNALASVGSTGSLNFLIIGFVLGICSGFCIPVSQQFGAGNIKEMRRYVTNGIYLCIGFIILLTTLTMVFTRQILKLLGTPDDIIDGAYDYIIIIFGGIAVIMIYNYLASVLRSMGDSKTPLYFLAIASVINVGLDLLFVIVFKMGVSGAGLATVIAQAVSVILCIIYIIKNYPILRFNRDEIKPSVTHMLRLLKIGVPMALQFSITAVGSLIMQSAINSLGTNAVAAVTTSNRISMLMSQPMETLGITMATFCGQNLGASKLLRIKKGVSTSFRIQMIYSVIAGIVLWFFGRYLAMIFIDGSETQILDNAAFFLKALGVSYPLLGVLFILRNSLQGMGYSFLPMFAGVCELVARSGVAFLLVESLQFTAVALSAPIAWLLADLLLIPAFIIIMKKLSGLPRRELNSHK